MRWVVRVAQHFGFQSSERCLKRLAGERYGRHYRTVYTGFSSVLLLVIPLPMRQLRTRRCGSGLGLTRGFPVYNRGLQRCFFRGCAGMWSGIVPGISITKGRCFGRVIAPIQQLLVILSLCLVLANLCFWSLSLQGIHNWGDHLVSSSPRGQGV